MLSRLALVVEAYWAINGISSGIVSLTGTISASVTIGARVRPPVRPHTRPSARPKCSSHSSSTTLKGELLGQPARSAVCLNPEKSGVKFASSKERSEADQKERLGDQWPMEIAFH